MDDIFLVVYPNGVIYFKVWLMEALSILGSRFGVVVDKDACPKIIKWRYTKRPKFTIISEFFLTKQVSFVVGYITQYALHSNEILAL